MNKSNNRRAAYNLADGLKESRMKYYLYSESLGYVIDENIRLTHIKSKATAYHSWSSAKDVLERIKPNLFNTDFTILMSAVKDS